MEVKLFIREGCPECPQALQACAAATELSVYDLADFHSLGEAFAWGVDDAPTVLVVDSAGQQVAAWRGVVPSSSDLRALLAN